MKTRTIKTMVSVSITGALLIATGCMKETGKDRGAPEKAGDPTESYSVSVTDHQFDTAGNMFAYAEFELAGEPLVEGLGLDLDLLDPKEVDQPAKFDYTAGIEAYEYSEEAMYEVVEKSGLGLHLINGPVVNEMAKEKDIESPEMLAERYNELADAAGYPHEEIFTNMFPTLIEYSKGDPHYIQEVDTSEYAPGAGDTYVPEYQMNFKSLRWDRAKMEKALNPAAYGGTFLKQALWAGDFLGGFHTKDKDEELAGETPEDDKDQNIALGVSAPDGMQGMFLVEGIWNKLSYIKNRLFYNGKELTSAGNGGSYDPSRGFVYLPHKIDVEEDGNERMPNAKSLDISDKRSLLNDQWLMLWPAAEFYGMTDQRDDNKSVAPSFRALFDGNPYPPAPKENVDKSVGNDIESTDPFTVNKDIILHIFKNIEAMHFNKEMGTFITEHDGKNQGNYTDTFQAGYTIESLRIFQRAIDGLPVGYASGEAAKGLGTEEGKRALSLIKAQADFINDELIMDNGMAAKGYTIGKGADQEVTLQAQIGAIRGLTAAYLATQDDKYRDAARNVFNAMDKKLWDEEIGGYKTGKEEMVYDAYTAGGVAAIFRVAINNLSNNQSDKEQPAALEVGILTEKYTEFFDSIIDGPSLEEGMQASEFWDTGDFYLKKGELGNTDQDNVPQIQEGHGKYGIAPVLLPVEIQKEK
ncbi:hypothetical protein [Bacillus sp. REN3]|uniref:hypothetical protein n=1 Tax=Bacillus sp. REN3 TaxID=2802440 RepID=UPI001AEF131F|nr:hypothetical protein [Bacillus sp. REN3]